MNFLSKIASWYFQKNSLPYWAILGVDCVLIIFSGLLANYLVCGGSSFIGHFWPLLFELILMQIPFFIGFKIFHTYSGIIRYSSFVDLARVFLANLVGVTITYLLFAVFPHGLGVIISVKALVYILSRQDPLRHLQLRPEDLSRLHLRHPPRRHLRSQEHPQ